MVQDTLTWNRTKDKILIYTNIYMRSLCTAPSIGDSDVGLRTFRSPLFQHWRTVFALGRVRAWKAPSLRLNRLDLIFSDLWAEDQDYLGRRLKNIDGSMSNLCLKRSFSWPLPRGSVWGTTVLWFRAAHWGKQPEEVAKIVNSLQAGDTLLLRWVVSNGVSLTCLKLPPTQVRIVTVTPSYSWVCLKICLSLQQTQWLYNHQFPY